MIHCTAVDVMKLVLAVLYVSFISGFTRYKNGSFFTLVFESVLTLNISGFQKRVVILDF